MSERWGDSQRDRDALDRHITGNYGEDQLSDDASDAEVPEPPSEYDGLYACPTCGENVTRYGQRCPRCERNIEEDRLERESGR